MRVIPPHALLKIHGLIQDGARPSTERLVQELEVSRRTVFRYIDYMRNTLRLPLEYCREYGGYIYTDTVEAFPTYLLSDREFENLVFLRQLLESFRGYFFYQDLRGLLCKIADFGVSGNVVSFQTPLMFRPRGLTRIDTGFFRELYEATHNNKEIIFDYRKQGSTEYAQRRVQPYQIVFSGRRWYLVGKCLNAKAERSFVLYRMSNLKVTNKSFQIPKDFDLNEAFLNHSLSFYGKKTDQNLIKIELDFDAIGADYLEETYEHPSMKIKKHDDGSMRVTLQLNNLLEIVPWVLHWGERVRVISPKELKQEVCRLAKKVLEVNAC